MGAHQASSTFEPAIWARLIQVPKEQISQDTARYLLSIQFGQPDRARMEELADRSEAGTLTANEEAEFDSYLHVANLLTVMHSEARLALRVGPADTRIRE
jgi:hypothetical protein